MPRVSDEHLERRRQQIIDAAATCFIRKGFHQTSMQDVFAESGLSAGAVYRYFKSKDELVGALASTHAGNIREQVADYVRRDPLMTPAELVGAVVGFIADPGRGFEGRIRLAPQAWSLAMTDEDVKGHIVELLTGVRALWREYAGRMHTAGWLAADADLDAVSGVLLSLMPGFILQHLIVGDPDPEQYARGVAALLPFGPAPTSEQT